MASERKRKTERGGERERIFIRFNELKQKNLFLIFIKHNSKMTESGPKTQSQSHPLGWRVYSMDNYNRLKCVQ